MVSRHIKKCAMYFPKSAFRPRIMSPSHGGRLHCLVRGLSNALSWKGLLTYISGSTVTGLLYDWVSSSDFCNLKATCNYISIHFWINSILNRRVYNILKHSFGVFYSCGIDFFKNSKNWMLRIFFSGCEIGYFGRLCDEKCRFPNYGLRCQFECNCSEKDCHHINGCGKFPSGAYFWIQNEIN